MREVINRPRSVFTWLTRSTFGRGARAHWHYRGARALSGAAGCWTCGRTGRSGCGWCGTVRQAEFFNCGIAAYDFEPEAKGMCIPELRVWNYGAPLEEEGAAKTSAPDAMAGTR